MNQQNLYFPHHNNQYYPSKEMMLKSIINNKNICLLCTGGSLDRVGIDLHEYDLVCGVNRIHQTKYVKNIDVFFHGCQNVDRAELSFPVIFHANKQAKIILMPIAKLLSDNHIEQISYIENLMKTNKNIIFDISSASMNHIKYGTRIYTGIASLKYILQYQPKSIDIFGMDFYNNGYTQNKNNKQLKKYRTPGHDVKVNFKVFSEILRKNSNINWILDKKLKSVIYNQMS